MFSAAYPHSSLQLGNGVSDFDVLGFRAADTPCRHPTTESGARVVGHTRVRVLESAASHVARPHRLPTAFPLLFIQEERLRATAEGPEAGSSPRGVTWDAASPDEEELLIDVPATHLPQRIYWYRPACLSVCLPACLSVRPSIPGAIGAS